VILIPEIPYHVGRIAKAILERNRGGKHFSIVAVAEGAEATSRTYVEEAARRKQSERERDDKKKARADAEATPEWHPGKSMILAEQLEQLTGLESRVTILGYLQRGGTPSAGDRMLATRLGTACAAYINEGQFGIMVAARGDNTEPVPLEHVVGKRKTVSTDHPWIDSARRVGTSFGD
jgi:6-phosphofructokinase 1